MEDFHAAIKKELEANDVFIIGGASIYKQMLPYYTEVLLTKIDADGGAASIYKQMLPYYTEVLLTKIDADGGAEVFFENIDEDPRFILVEEGEPLLDEGRYIRFCRYRSISPESL